MGRIQVWLRITSVDAVQLLFRYSEHRCATVRRDSALAVLFPAVLLPPFSFYAILSTLTALLPAQIVSEDPCSHCYCMHSEVKCAVETCASPLDNAHSQCKPVPPRPGQCCPDQYNCGECPPQSMCRNRKVTSEIVPSFVSRGYAKWKSERCKIAPMHEWKNVK